MKKIIIIFFAFFILYAETRLENYSLIGDKNFIKSSRSSENKVGGNFILDMIKDTTSIFVATGDGISICNDLTIDAPNLQWQNSYIGYGGASAIAFSNDKKTIWMTTASDTFVTDLEPPAFLSMGTGVHKSTDNGLTWTHFKQPGLTPIQGLTYDIACDTLGRVWLASFGQSLQRSSDQGETWKTLVPEQKEWDPASPNNYNQRIFAVHHTPNNKLWVGSAAGINLAEDYSVADTLVVWKNYHYPSLTGNFVTAISSQIVDNKEILWVASWAKDTNEEYGVSFTNDNGLTWQRALIGEKIYSFGFKGDAVFACGVNGLWKSSDQGLTWEKYNISVYSELKKGYINIDKVYSFNSLGDKLFVGTGKGLLISSDEGNNWYLSESYKNLKNNSKTYAYPNPFSLERFGEIKLQFNLIAATSVNCTIYNFAMEKVREVAKAVKYSAGDHYLTWNGRDDYNSIVANGVYFYIIEINGKKVWNKIIVFD